MVNAIGEAVEFVCGWKEKGVINGVITKNNKLINNDFEHCIKDQLFELRVIRERLKTTEIYFKVSSRARLYKFVESQMKQCKEKRTRIEF